MVKLICFDCDGTLSAVEGVDELARMAGPGAFSQVEEMTSAAMNGSLRLEQVFARRLEIIRPTRDALAAVGRLYIETVEPSAKATVALLAERGWTAIVVSAGYRLSIRPLADFLGIARVEAVDIHFGPDGGFRGYDAAFPATRSGGKAEILRRLRAELRPARVVMVGDGVSDLEAKPAADLFVGFGRYVERERVRREAGAFIHSLSELPPLLGG
jgi:phosphoserine phosphatase